MDAGFEFQTDEEFEYIHFTKKNVYNNLAIVMMFISRLHKVRECIP